MPLPRRLVRAPLVPRARVDSLSRISARDGLFRTHDGVGADDETCWRSAWAGLAVTPARPRASAAADEVLRRPVAPMLAAPVDAVPEGPGLVHEPKWDGWRAIAFRDTGGVYLQSRAGWNLST